MAIFKLLDTDLIINLIRTLALLDLNQREIILQAIEGDKYFQFITTSEVKNEIKERLSRDKLNNETDEFFSNRRTDIKKIKRRLFKKIRILSISKDSKLTLFSTNLRNLGERSLVILLISKYHTQIHSNQNTVNIVSNNHRDIRSIYKKTVQLYHQISNLPNEITNLQYIQEFYIELLLHLKIDRELIVFFLILSNIDCKAINSKIIKSIRNLF